MSNDDVVILAMCGIAMCFMCLTIAKMIHSLVMTEEESEESEP